MHSLRILALVGAASIASANTVEVVRRAPSSCIAYTNALTGAKSCCDPTTGTLFYVNAGISLGICCPFNTILSGLVCTAPPPPPSSGVCSGNAVCPSKSGQDLGIKYSSCYVLQALTGNYLGHDSNVTYEVLGENPGVVFRVCAGQGDCVTNAGKLVGANGTWYLEDQFGDPGAVGFGWLGGSGDLSVQDSASNALLMGGTSICYGGKCSVCITFPPGGAHAPCPLSPGQSHLGIATNPNNCQPFFWQEVGCLSEA